LCAAAEQDHGWLRGASLGEERAEVGIGRDDDPIFGGGTLGGRGVSGCLERVLTNVHGIAAGGDQLLGDRGASSLSIRNLDPP